MSDIVKNLRDNPFNKVSKSHYKCPKCGSDLYTAYNRMGMVFDGNTVFHCEKNKEHRFWQNAREVRDVLHLNEYASSTNFTSYRDYELVNGVWKKDNGLWKLAKIDFWWFGVEFFEPLIYTVFLMFFNLFSWHLSILHGIIASIVVLMVSKPLTEKYVKIYKKMKKISK